LHYQSIDYRHTPIVSVDYVQSALKRHETDRDEEKVFQRRPPWGCRTSANFEAGGAIQVNARSFSQMSRRTVVEISPDEWLYNRDLRVLSAAARALWMDMLCLMRESVRRGYLQHANGNAITHEQLARLTGCSSDDCQGLLQELETSGVFSRTVHGMIYYPKMLRAEQKRAKCTKAGKRGGNPMLLKPGDP
jgi:hypothetical protein